MPFLRDGDADDVRRVLSAAGLTRCPDCRAALASSVHDCPLAGRWACPVLSCRVSAEKKATIMAHLRNLHSGVLLSAVDERRLGIGRCTSCLDYYKGVKAHEAKCRRGPGARARGAAPRTPARTPPCPAPVALRPPMPSRSESLPGAPIGLAWSFGAPGGRSGCSVRMSWAFVPMIRCALGLGEAGGLARFLAGNARWDGWRDAYAADFVARGITVESLPFDENGYIEEKEQLRLLRGRLLTAKATCVMWWRVSSRGGWRRRCVLRLLAARPPLLRLLSLTRLLSCVLPCLPPLHRCLARGRRAPA